MKKSPQSGFTLIELLITVAIVGIIAAIAVPGLLRARMAGNEASAIGSLRTVNSSQQSYSATCGRGYFASNLMILADPAPVGSAFISPDLGAATVINKSGYRLTMAEGSEATNSLTNGCNPSGTAANLFTSYYAFNEPAIGSVTGSRWFWTNSLGAVYVATTNVFAAVQVGNAPPGAGAPLQ